MKVFHFNILSLFLISILFLHNGIAQNYHQWDLPDGAISRIGKGTVKDVTFSPDGRRLIVQTGIGLWIYDVSTGTELNLKSESTSQILDVSPYSNAYVILDSSNTLHVRDLENHELNVSLMGDTEGIRQVIFSPDRKILSGMYSDYVYLWDITTGKQMKMLKVNDSWFRTIAFSSDGQTIASVDSGRTLRLWDVATGIEKATLSKYTHGIGNLIITPDDKTLISGSDNGNVKLWDIESGELRKEIDTVALRSIAVSPDGKTIAVGGYEGLHLYNAITGAYIAKLGGHIRGVGRIAFSPDGSTLASSGAEELFIWDTESKRRLVSIDGHVGVWGMAISPDGNTLATSNREKIYFWSLNNGQNKALIFAGHHSIYRDLAFSPDGSTLACIDSLIVLWDLSNYVFLSTLFGIDETLQPNTTLRGYTSIVYSTDGQYLAAGNRNRNIHLFYQGRTFATTLRGHTDEVTSIAFSQDTTMLASGSKDNTVRLWDVNAATEIHTCKGHTDNVNYVAINHDGSIIASGSDDATIILWDTITGLPISMLTGHTQGIQSLAFSHDGKTLVSCAGADDPTIRLWDVATGEQKILNGHRLGPRLLYFSPDGNTFVTANWDGEILIWDYKAIIGEESQPVILSEDVNRDGVVDVQDLIYVASQFGNSDIENQADINKDGVVNIADILLVAAAITNKNAAPLKLTQAQGFLTHEKVQDWINQATQLFLTTTDSHQGLNYLKQLLVHLTPNQTLLLTNYPNPFNPETWIPYQLATTTNAKITIFSANGVLIRTLELGYKPAGIYHDQSRAAYWDGKNQNGEPVASGVYFYSFSAGKYMATKRMVIRK
ncbi:hypothetical protein C6497_11530 [Candidatus Poribacteria bacterium]|nr:MAG: hypothetical protein C6497_11530 [Candidatus Poribacteria bacterium]